MMPPIDRAISKLRRLAIAPLSICVGLAATCAAGDEVTPLLSAPFDAEQAAAAQRHWATRLKTEVETKNSIGMTLALIPPGEFRMGNAESAESATAFAIAMGLRNSKAGDFGDEYPQHLVRITRAFRMSRHEVTRAAFAVFINETGYRTEAETDGKGGWGWDKEQQRFVQKPEFNWLQTGFPQTDDHPVVNVSWNDARRFCEWLGKKEQQAYRLPTEAEWEFVNRAGTEARYQSGDHPEALAAIANVADGTALATYPDWPAISAKDGFTYTAPVGSFQANAFGQFDMHGNVWEWCEDYFDPAYYEQSPTDDPAGPSTGKLRVSRGGAWSRTPVNCRCSVRRSGEPTLRHINIGFRPVVTLAGE